MTTQVTVLTGPPARGEGRTIVHRLDQPCAAVLELFAEASGLSARREWLPGARVFRGHSGSSAPRRPGQAPGLVAWNEARRPAVKARHEAVLEALCLGRRVRDVARRFGLSERYVYLLAARDGIRLARRVEPGRDDRIAQLVLSGLSMREVGRRFDLGPWGVQNVMKKLGIRVGRLGRTGARLPTALVDSILSMVASGATNREASERLGIALGTVEYYAAKLVREGRLERRPKGKRKAK